MRPFLKITLAAGLFVLSGATVLLAANLITANTMTEAEVAAMNALEGSGDGAGPGPYGGWIVTSADNMNVGTVTFSVQDADGKIEFLNILLPSGNKVRIANGVADMGEGTIALRLTKAEIDANSTAGFSNIVVE